MQHDPVTEARCLIIDDEVANVRLLDRMLREWGCLHVTSTTDPREARFLYTTTQPDIILLDLMMPEVDGFAVMEQLQPLIPAESYLPILVLTADTSMPTKRRALAAGAKDFLTKPFDAVELALRVRTLLQTRALHLQLADQNTLLETRVQERTQDLLRAYDTTITGWSRALDLRDKETEGHSQRVTALTLDLARAQGMSDVELVQVRRGALLHDIGKMGVPDAILLKPGPLTEDEWIIMRQHPVYAYDLLTPIVYLRSALDIPYCHHEKWDGSGYPRGLAGERIPLAARIFAMVDVWDALRSDRPYRPAWPVGKTRAHILSLAGTHFDPNVVETFLGLAHEGGLDHL